MGCLGRRLAGACLGMVPCAVAPAECWCSALWAGAAWRGPPAAPRPATETRLENRGGAFHGHPKTQISSMIHLRRHCNGRARWRRRRSSASMSSLPEELIWMSCGERLTELEIRFSPPGVADRRAERGGHRGLCADRRLEKAQRVAGRTSSANCPRRPDSFADE